MSPVLGQGSGEVMMGLGGGEGFSLVPVWGEGPGSPVAASWESSIPFPRGSAGQREGAAGAMGFVWPRGR